MDLITVVIVAFGLATDAFAVSVASGIAIKKIHIKHALKMSLAFGGFQAVMPMMGWLAGIGLKGFISAIDHWIAFALLSAVGGKMIYESFTMSSTKKESDFLTLYMLLVLSIATSIDAFAVGMTFAFLKVRIVIPIIIIGSITFVLSFAGVYLGKRLGHVYESRIELAGGLILIAIGVKIVLGHIL